LKETKHKLTLDRQATCQIEVSGELDESWFDWDEKLTIVAESEGDGQPVSTLTGTIDQAALQGLLHRLYSLGLPLISVICVDYKGIQSLVDSSGMVT
jgi:hypothetical protein